VWYALLIGAEGLNVHGSREVGLGTAMQGSCYGGCFGLMALDDMD
jgi:hypothetical protein